MHGALRGELGAHPVVQRVEFVLGEEAARHAGLVGEEEHEIAGLVEPADRFRRVRHPADAVARAHVAVVVIDDAVAVEECRGPALASRSTPLMSGLVSASGPARPRRRCRGRRRDGSAGSPACRRWARPADDRRRAPMRCALGAGEADGDQAVLRARRCSAARMFGERPEVDSASSTSPRRPRPSTWRANTCSKP